MPRTLEDLFDSPVGEVARRAAVQVGPDAPLRTVVGAMRSAGQGVALVVGPDQALVGIFTEQDAVDRVATIDPSAWPDLPVRAVMTPDPVTVGPDASIGSVVRLWERSRFRRVPLVDARGAVCGVIAIGDVLGHLVEHFPQAFINVARRAPWSAGEG